MQGTTDFTPSLGVKVLFPPTPKTPIIKADMMTFNARGYEEMVDTGGGGCLMLWYLTCMSM